MKIAILKERAPAETRVAASPETVKKYVELGAEVIIESGAGLSASVSDDEFSHAGASIRTNAEEILAEADVVLKLQPSGEALDDTAFMKSGSILIGLLSPLDKPASLQQYADRNITAFSMEMVPRITRAQSMDVLSSQSNLAGYKAVLDAVSEFGKAIPMMMTAAGTIAPAKVLILGAGVAGLQAIATAKRLGAVVSAFDVRPAAREQVQSLGAKFIEVDADATQNAETAGGYAKEMDEAYKKKQQELIHETLKKHDIAITTALIPGKPAPVLITEEMVKDMKAGSVIVDLAVMAGGNCTLSKPGKIVTKYDVKIIGYENVAARVATDASKLYAKNLLNFLSLLIDKENKKISLNFEDEILKASVVSHEGRVTIQAR